jgi:hypothetical protein
MGAPKGHPKWGNPIKPKIFETPEDLWSSACSYFEWCDENPWIKKDFIKSGDMAGKIVDIEIQRPYTLEGMCNFLNISLQTFYNYESKEEYKTYFEIATRIRKIIYNQKFEGAAVGAFNANIIARDLGLADKQDHKVQITKKRVGFGKRGD